MKTPKVDVNETMKSDDNLNKTVEELPVYKYHPSDLSECTQTQTITSIQHLLEQMSELQIEERHERRESEKRIMDILEKLADQGARINHLEQTDVAIIEDVDGLFVRMREAEKAIVEEDPRIATLNAFYSITTSKLAIALYTLFGSFIMVDIVVNLAEHGAKIIDVFERVFKALL